MARRGEGGTRPPGDYEVGYGKPPKHTRWQKGHSPNPRGRPSKANTVAAILDRLLHAKVTIRDGTASRKITRLEYLLMRAIEKAGKGDLHALKFTIEMRQRFPSLTPDMDATKGGDPDDLTIIEAYVARLKDDGEELP